MSDEWTVKVRAPKHQRVAVGFETRPATKVRFKQLAMRWRSGQLQTKRRDLALRAALAHGENPRQNHIHEQIGLRFRRFDIREFHGSFPSLFVYTNFLRAREFFISAEPLERVGEGAAAHDRNGGRVRP